MFTRLTKKFKSSKTGEADEILIMQFSINSFTFLGQPNKKVGRGGIF